MLLVATFTAGAIPKLNWKLFGNKGYLEESAFSDITTN